MPSIRFPRPIVTLLLTAALALVGMGMNSLVVESVIFHSAGSTKLPAEVNAPYMRILYMPQEIAVHFFYRGYGNTVLRLTPRYCFTKGFQVNGIKHSFPNKQATWCQELAVDLGRELHHGNNTLTVSVNPTDASWGSSSPIVGLAVGSPLFGTHLAQSVFTLIFLGSVLSLVWLLLARRGYDALTRLILIAGYGLYLQCLQCLHQFDYTVDWERHAAYIQYVSDHFFAPYNYTAGESWHPPFYYWVCALAAKGLELFGTFDVWSGIRLVSLVSYATFMYFGMRAIMRVLPKPACYFALALLVFWPSGMFNAAWVYNDVLLYPFYAAAFYYTLAWYEDNETSDLLKAFICCGLAFMVKTSALVPTSILGACIGYKWLIGQYPLRRLLSRELFFGWFALAGGILFNFEREIFYFFIPIQWGPGHLACQSQFQATLENFTLFNIGDLITHPFFVSWEDSSLWNLQIRLMLFTNSIWRYPQLASCLQLLCLLMLTYVVIFVVTLPLRKYHTWFPILSGLVLPFAATVAFTVICHVQGNIDFRYIQPALIAIVMAFCLSVQHAKDKNWTFLYYAGYGIASLFTICSIVFFELQML